MAKQLKKLITAIQEGPIKERDAPNLDPKRFEEWENEEIRLRLGKLAYAGVELTGDAAEIGRKYLSALNRDALTDDEYFRSGVEVGSVQPATADDLFGEPGYLLGKLGFRRGFSGSGFGVGGKGGFGGGGFFSAQPE